MSHLCIRFTPPIRLIPLPCTARLLSSTPRKPHLPPDDILSRDSSAGTFNQSGHAGPFPIGSIYDNEREEKVRAAERSWRQLKGTEKVGRAWLQLSSLLVVLVGGGLFVVVGYSTGSELFSTNSPTRVFEDCVERVKESDEIKSVLLEPLIFHGANSSNRLRRNRRISSTLTQDPKDGQDILVVRFWVEGASAKSKLPGEENWWDTVKGWVGPLIWEDSTKPGSYVPRPSGSSSQIEVEKPPPVPEVKRSWAGWVGDGLASVVGGLIPRPGKNGTLTGDVPGGGASVFKRPRKPLLGEFETGEAVAELKKDPETNTFVYRKLYVDVPDSRAPNAYRIYINTAVTSPPTRLADRIRFWQTPERATSIS